MSSGKPTSLQRLQGVSLPSAGLTLIDKYKVLAKTGGGNSNLYDSIGQGLCTKPVKIGARSRWPEHEIDAVIHARIAGVPESQIRDLVVRLHANREVGFKAIQSQLEAVSQ
jgi:prophage regulatory protein